MRYLFLIPVLVMSVLAPSLAVGDDDGDNVISVDDYVVADDDEPLLFDLPLPVVVVEDEIAYQSYADSPALSASVVIGDTPPASPLFYGTAWVTGTDSRLGTVTVYFPANCKVGYFGTDRNGYLINVNSGSVSGYLAGVYNNSVSASALSAPTYRVYSGSTYTTYTLNLRPINSNMDIAVSNTPKYTLTDFIPYISIFLLGVIVVCFIKR